MDLKSIKVTALLRPFGDSGNDRLFAMSAQGHFLLTRHWDLCYSGRGRHQPCQGAARTQRRFELVEGTIFTSKLNHRLIMLIRPHLGRTHQLQTNPGEVFSSLFFSGKTGLEGRSFQKNTILTSVCVRLAECNLPFLQRARSLFSGARLQCHSCTCSLAGFGTRRLIWIVFKRSAFVSQSKTIVCLH